MSEDKTKIVIMKLEAKCEGNFTWAFFEYPGMTEFDEHCFIQMGHFIKEVPTSDLPEMKRVQGEHLKLQIKLAKLTG